MGRHAKTRNADEPVGTSKGRVLKWLKVTALVVVILVLLAAVGALALLAKVSNSIRPVDDKEITRQMERTKPLAPQNILLLGSDNRGKEKWARSDTILIAHIDTVHKRVTLLSIPRDMRVDIPGYGLDKVNAAMSLGGPSLTIKTLKQFTGLPINHFAEVDFEGFKQLVNAVGGVYINVEKPIDDPKAGPPLEKGYQRLFGKTALAYVRTRKDVRGDYARIEHQQKFFAALVSQSARFQTVFRLPQLVNIFAENVKTDMTLSEMSQLAMHMRSIKKNSVEGVTLPSDDEMINSIWYTIPREGEIARICARVKKNQPVKAPKKEGGKSLAAKPKPVRPRDVTVEIKNGGGPSGSAAELGRKLNGLGYMVAKVGNATRGDYTTTQIVYRSDRAKAESVKGVIGKGELTVSDGQYEMTGDVLVIVGQDY